MHINLEATDKYSIEAYSDTAVQVNSLVYQTNLIVSSHGIISDWAIANILHLDENSLAPLLQYNPTIIILGHKQQGEFPPLAIRQKLAKEHIGLECMSIGAACRTYNVLLSELREVVVGIIF